MTKMNMEQKIREWLDKGGYPFEMEVTRLIKKAGFKVAQSEFYLDEETNTYRETDIVAYEMFSDGPNQTIICFVIECKVSQDKPWVLFTEKSYLSTEIAIQRRASSNIAKGILTKLSLVSEIRELSTLKLPDRSAYSVAAAFQSDSKAPDRAYKALMSVLSATSGIVKKIEKAARSDTIYIYAFPLIVLKGQLFEAYLNEGGDMQVANINSGVLVWRNPILSTQSIVPIVTHDELSDYFANLKKDAEVFSRVANDNI
jgi:hypothetical protein